MFIGLAWEANACVDDSPFAVFSIILTNLYSFSPRRVLPPFLSEPDVCVFPYFLKDRCSDTRLRLESICVPSLPPAFINGFLFIPPNALNFLIDGSASDSSSILFVPYIATVFIASGSLNSNVCDFTVLPTVKLGNL